MADNSTPVGQSFYAYFSGPATGHQLVSLQRALNYFGKVNRPSVKQMADSLVAKYGPPSFTSPGMVMQMQWTYQNGHLVADHPELNSFWRAAEFVSPSNDYEVGGMNNILNARQRDQYNVLVALHCDPREKDILDGMSVTISSGALRAQIAQADAKTTLDALKKAVAAAGPATLPNL